MRVLVLGAGASLNAGYPQAMDLFKRLKLDAEESHAEQLQDAWRYWTQAIETAPDEIKALLTAKNPEIVLSILDLCETFIHENFEEIFPEKNRTIAVSQSLYPGQIDPELFTSREHAWLDRATNAKNHLVLSLSEYFLWRHYEDGSHPEKRTYLRDLVEKLDIGDIIITLNWDTTIERTLFEMGRWSPRDGYGFIKRFRTPEEFGESSLLASSIMRPSEVQVLKLHGSVGWHAGTADDLQFGDLFLQSLLTATNENGLVDADARPFHDTLPPLLAYPSYLKRFENRYIRSIWQRADAALRAANIIEFWGYSLPASDSSIGVLLQSLRWRNEAGEVRVFVHNPNGEHLDRFRQFFDGHAFLDKQRLGP